MVWMTFPAARIASRSRRGRSHNVGPEVGAVGAGERLERHYPERGRGGGRFGRFEERDVQPCLDVRPMRALAASASAWRAFIHSPRFFQAQSQVAVAQRTA